MKTKLIVSFALVASFAATAFAGSATPTVDMMMRKENSKPRPFIDLNQDGYVGPTEKKIMNMISDDKGLQKNMAEKFGLTKEEITKAIESGKSVGDLMREKGISKEDAIAEASKNVDEVVKTKIDEALKSGKISKAQADRIKAEADERLAKVSEKMKEMASSTEMVKKPGVGERIKGFFNRIFKRNNATTTNVTATTTVL